jgi:hypothetical protein
VFGKGELDVIEGVGDLGLDCCCGVGFVWSGRLLYSYYVYSHLRLTYLPALALGWVLPFMMFIMVTCYDPFQEMDG